MEYRRMRLFSIGQTPRAYSAASTLSGSRARKEITPKSRVLPAPANYYQDVGLTASTTYTYRVRTESSAGFSGYSNEVSASTPALPLPPAPSLEATAVSSSQIDLSWTSAATGILR